MPTDRPTSRELVDAVGAFLEAEVQPALTGSVAFHTKVAVNVLRIVARELDTGDALDQAEMARLTLLLGRDTTTGVQRAPGDAATEAPAAGRIGSDDATATLEALNAALVDGVRAGRLGLDTPGLVDHLRATVLGKLSIDNPRYESYRRALAKQD